MSELIMTDAVLTGYENSIKSLEEIIRSQDILIESMQNSLLRLPRHESVNEICKMSQRCQFYTNKLLKLRNQMSILDERVSKLKIRADNLKKQREEAIRKAMLEQQRIANFERQLADARMRKTT